MTAGRRCALLVAGFLAVACGATGEADRPGAAGNAHRPGGGRNGVPKDAPMAAVPVETAPVVRRDIASYLETNGTLEAENEVDIVARTSGPIVELATEEGRRAGRGELLARIDDAEIRAELEIARVNLADAKLNFERAERLAGLNLISAEEHEQALSRFETAKATLEGQQIQLGYTRIEAPFAGWIVRRYVDLGQQASPGEALLRISDFEPLLCPVQIPERELRRLAVGQRASVAVEAWPGERFSARVLRVSPVVDAATGTVKVTLDVDGRGRLRPGMFARVFLETDVRQDALVMPRAALALESIGDTVYVVRDGRAARRDVELGFEEGDFVEVTSGVAEGERVVVVGQDGLSDGTPVQVLGERGAASRRGDSPEAGNRASRAAAGS